MKINHVSHSKMGYLAILSLMIITFGCSYRYLAGPFGQYAEATGLVGKNAVYCFEQLQAEEINLRVAEQLDAVLFGFKKEGQQFAGR